MDRARASAAPRASRTCAAPSSPCAARRRCCSATSPTCARRPRCAAASRTGCSGEVVSCRIVKQFGADTVQVAAGIRAGDRRDPARSLPKGVQLRIVYDQSELVDVRARRRGPRGAARRRLRRARPVRCCSATCAPRCIVTLTIPLSIALAGLAAAAGWRRPEHDDARRPRDRGRAARRRGDHRDREHRAPPDAGTRAGERRASARSRAAIEVGRPIAFATLIVIAVFLPLFGMAGIEGRMYQPLAAAVIAARGGRRWSSR